MERPIFHLRWEHEALYRRKPNQTEQQQQTKTKNKNIWCPGHQATVLACDAHLTTSFDQHTAQITGEECGRRKSSLE